MGVGDHAVVAVAAGEAEGPQAGGEVGFHHEAEPPVGVAHGAWFHRTAPLLGTPRTHRIHAVTRDNATLSRTGDGSHPIPELLTGIPHPGDTCGHPATMTQADGVIQIT
ncbi:hypothetical protein GCM10023148_33290 [Actinokineospora soli]